MPNDLTAKRNLLNWHPESRSESQRQTTSEPLENKGFFPRGGGGVYLDNFGHNACGV